jgi:hypothetical protein
MIKDNYLIRRPLLKVGQKVDCGFESQLAHELLENTDSDDKACHQSGKVCE